MRRRKAELENYLYLAGKSQDLTYDVLDVMGKSLLEKMMCLFKRA